MSTNESRRSGEGESRAATAAEGGSDERTRGGPAGGQLPPELAFQILRTRRRRLLLGQLRECGGRTSIGEAAVHIAAVEAGVPSEEVSANGRKSVYIGLYQCHLPKMAEAGVVDFDPDSGTIRLREAAAPLFEYPGMRREDERAPAGSTRLRPAPGVVFAATGVVLGALLGVPVLGAFRGPWLALLVAGTALAASALCSLADARSGE